MDRRIYFYTKEIGTNNRHSNRLCDSLPAHEYMGDCKSENSQTQWVTAVGLGDKFRTTFPCQYLSYFIELAGHVLRHHVEIHVLCHCLSQYDLISGPLNDQIFLDNYQ